MDRYRSPETDLVYYLERRLDLIISSQVYNIVELWRMMQKRTLTKGSVEILTANPEQTLTAGECIGTQLFPGAVAVLGGNLGAGKTWLTKGIAAGLGVQDTSHVTSPAYDLVHEYEGRCTIYHLDFYRLEVLTPSDQGWIDEYLFGGGVTIIEWGGKFIESLRVSHLSIEISFGNEDEERVITLRPIGGAYERVTNEVYRCLES